MSVLDRRRKSSDVEAPVLEFWGMWSSPSLPFLPDPLWPRVVVPVRVPSISQIELLNSHTWNLQTECKQMSCGLFKNYLTNYSLTKNTTIPNWFRKIIKLNIYSKYLLIFRDYLKILDILDKAIFSTTHSERKDNKKK